MNNLNTKNDHFPFAALGWAEQDDGLLHIEVEQAVYEAADPFVGADIELLCADGCCWGGEVKDYWAHKGGGATLVITNEA